MNGNDNLGPLWQRHDPTALADWQRESVEKLIVNLRLEDEAYFSQHPEIAALLSAYISNLPRKNKKEKSTMNLHCAQFLARDEKVLDKVVRKVLNLPPEVPYSKKGDPPFVLSEPPFNLLLRPTDKPIGFGEYISSSENTINTLSSSFLSIHTSDTTMATPEPTPPPVQTFSEYVYEWVSNIVDKAFYSKFDDYDIKYDTAYIEIQIAAENAMEITVEKIKEDIGELIQDAWQAFEENIIAKEEAAAYSLWSKRMRKKTWNKTMRLAHNFKGYKSPQSSAESSSDEDYSQIIRPCRCFPQHPYNRYPKDRFGVYLPQKAAPSYNVTPMRVTSATSTQSGKSTLTAKTMIE